MTTMMRSVRSSTARATRFLSTEIIRRSDAFVRDIDYVDRSAERVGHEEMSNPGVESNRAINTSDRESAVARVELDDLIAGGADSEGTRSCLVSRRVPWIRPRDMMRKNQAPAVSITLTVPPLPEI